MKSSISLAALAIMVLALFAIAIPSSDADYSISLDEIEYHPESGTVSVAGTAYCDVYLSVSANGYYSDDTLVSVKDGTFSYNLEVGKLHRGIYRVSAVAVEDNLDYAVKQFSVGGYVYLDSASLSLQDSKLSVSGYSSDDYVEITVADLNGTILADGVPASCDNCVFSTSFLLSGEIKSDLTVKVALVEDYTVSDSVQVLSRQVTTDSDQDISLFTGESVSVHLIVEGCEYSELGLSSTDKTIATFGEVSSEGKLTISAGYAEGTATVYVSVGSSVLEFRVTVTEKVVPAEKREYTFNLKVYYDAELADVGSSGLTLLDLQQGITLTAEAYNAGEALEMALTDMGIPCSFWSQDSYKHWVNHIMGLKEVKYDNGDYKYWIQYRMDADGNPVYNQWTLGWYTEGGIFDLIYGITDPDGKMVIPDDYSLVIDSNNGSYAVDATSVLSTLPSVQLPGSVSWTKTGCTAVGFNSLPDGTGESFAFGQTVSMEYIKAHSDTSRSAVFYVQWVSDDISYSVTYLCDSELFLSSDYKEGAEVVLPNLPVREGYKVSAWTSDDVELRNGRFIMPGNSIVVSCTTESIPVKETQIDNGDGSVTTTTITETETGDGYAKTEKVETITDSTGQVVSTKTDIQETKTDSDGSSVKTSTVSTVSDGKTVTTTETVVADSEGKISSVTNTVKESENGSETVLTQGVVYTGQTTTVEYSNEIKDSESNVSKIDAILEMPDGALEDISNLELTVSTVDVNTLDESVRKQIGDSPVFDYTLTASGTEISEFSKTVRLSIYYLPAPGESTEDLVVFHIADDGKVTKHSCTYDSTTNMVLVELNHFSMYAVGHEASASNGFTVALGVAIGIVILLSAGLLIMGTRRNC